MTRYRCVTARKAEGFAVTDACAAAGVSTSAFYAWVVRPEGPTEAEREEAELLNQIVDIHRGSDGTYGEPRITPALRRAGWVVNHKRVARLMHDNGLVGHRPKKRRSLTRPDTAAAPLPDLVGRDFDPEELDHTWVGDITYIPTEEGWLYLATVIDLASRRLIGYSMDVVHDAALVEHALEHAVTTRGQRAMEGTIFHHDRGSEYTSGRFRGACARLGLTQSASRTGSCLDNAVAESFFATLKVELVNRCRYATRGQARASIFAFIARYNNRRLHSTLDYVPPVEFEQQLTARTAPLPSPMAA